MSVRGKLRKFAVIATIAAAAAVITPTAAVAHGGEEQPYSSASGLSAGNAAVGLVGPRFSWLEFFENVNG
ncbi:hypothetical protein GCM10009639_02180 [Kitasatospora putterlickiae]|uniref:Uncharacterized protein n=1 Tax=Kitasatospora putterlickiae TaxID=221725 RepID=A0ABP4I6W2_9ACTN